MIIFGAGDYSFNTLDGAGRQIQLKALEEFRHFADIVQALLRQQPKAAAEAVARDIRTITELI